MDTNVRDCWNVSHKKTKVIWIHFCCIHSNCLYPPRLWIFISVPFEWNLKPSLTFHPKLCCDIIVHFMYTDWTNALFVTHRPCLILYIYYKTLLLFSACQSHKMSLWFYRNQSMSAAVCVRVCARVYAYVSRLHVHVWVCVRTESLFCLQCNPTCCWQSEKTFWRLAFLKITTDGTNTNSTCLRIIPPYLSVSAVLLTDERRIIFSTKNNISNCRIFYSLQVCNSAWYWNRYFSRFD